MIINQLKTFVFCFALVLIGGSAYATAINFEQVNTAEDWAKVTAKAQSQGLDIFVDVYTDWCGYCKMMDRDVFSDQEVGDYFNARFINVKLDAETSFGEVWAANYEVTGYPTYIFLNNEEEYIGEIGGYNEKAEFMAESKSIIENASVLPQLEAGYESGSLSKSEKMTYATMILDQDSEKAQRIADEIIPGLTDSDMLNPDNIDFLATFVTGVKDPIFQFIKNNRAAFVDAHGADGKDEVVGNVYNIVLGAAVAEEDPAKMDIVIKEILPLYVDDPSEVANGAFVTKKLYYANVGDWDAYKNEVESSHGKDGISQEDYWYVQAYGVIEDYNYESTIMEAAFTWLDKALEVETDFETYYLYSYALGVNGDYPGAKEKALKAKEIARDEDQRAAVEEIIGMIDEAAAGE